MLLRLLQLRGLRGRAPSPARDAAEAQLGRAIEIAAPLRQLRLGLGGLRLFLQLAQLADQLLLVLPDGLHLIDALAQLRDLRGHLRQPLRGRLVLLLAQRLLLDGQRRQPALQLIDRIRPRIDLHLQAAGRLVDQVDRLVGQLAPRDVTVRQPRRRDQRGVTDADTVVNLVAFLEAAKDRDRVLHRRLADEHGLEAALQRLVLLDVLAVLVQRRRADAAQIAARQRRLEHVGRVDRALRAAGADQRVQLVDEQDDAAGRRLDLLEHGLEAVLELAAVLAARDQRARGRATGSSCPSATRARRRSRCAARCPRRWRSCRRPGRR